MTECSGFAGLHTEDISGRICGGLITLYSPLLRTVRHWRTSVFTKNTIVQVRYLALLSIDFSRKMGYNCYCDKNNDPRGKYYIIKER